MKFLIFLLILLASAVFAAPDEALLGKADGYPLCPSIREPVPERCLVAQFSRYDELLPRRKVARSASPRALKPAASPPDLKADAFLDANRNTGLLVLKGDTVLAERYQYDRTPEHRFASMSMAKTVVAMLVGIALAEKKIGSIDDRADQYVAELKGHPYGETSLRHLLTMSSGVKFSEQYNGQDDLQVLARRTFGQQGPGGADTVLPFKERARPAGEKFSYSSAEAQVLGLVLRAATGKPLAEYLSEKIWQPMGAEADATWLVDAGGYEIAYCCLNATLRDFGRLGMLLANDGALDGRQIIPAEWVRAATTPEAPHLRVGTASRYNGYGYQTWIISEKARQFALLGVRGQGIFIDPVSKLVIVHTAVHAGFLDAARNGQFQFFFATLRKLES